MIVISISFIAGVLYVFLVILFVVGWNRHYAFEPRGNEEAGLKVSVVVACKNEERNIRQLISCIAQQSYQDFELIIVDDHSKDATRAFVKQAIRTLPQLKMIDAAGNGKKNALKEGILQSENDFIVTIDADCVPTFHWLESIVCFQEKLPSDLLICPVRIKESDGVLLRIQALEFVSLVAAGAGAAGMGMPILCNGANLAFRKKAWLESQHELHDEIASGDDIFLLHSVKKRKGVIRFLRSESALVDTKPVTSLPGFFKQRIRWTSKAPAYTDLETIAVAAIVLGTALSELVLLVGAFENMDCLVAFGVLFCAKYLVDFLFLSHVQKFFYLKNVGLDSMLLSLIYPFYIVSVVVMTFFGGWRGRSKGLRENQRFEIIR
ncbi:MAG TPA: glycosyltransferase [Paludibacter sp.]|nr:glycosyltransferase [Paludibacter sp.]